MFQLLDIFFFQLQYLSLKIKMQFLSFGMKGVGESWIKKFRGKTSIVFPFYNIFVVFFVKQNEFNFICICFLYSDRRVICPV